MPITIVPIEDDKPKKKSPTGKKPRSQKPMPKRPPQKKPIKKKMGGKASKYRAKGGVIQKKAGKVVLSGMAARRNARRGNI